MASAKLNLGGTRSSSKILQNISHGGEEEVDSIEKFKIRSVECGNRRIRGKNDGDKSASGPWKAEPSTEEEGSRRKGVLLLETDLDQLDSYNGTGG